MVFRKLKDDWRKNNPIRNREINKNNKKRAREQLHSWYVKDRLRMPAILITPEMVELKREQIKLWRELKTLKEGLKEWA